MSALARPALPMLIGYCHNWDLTMMSLRCQNCRSADISISCMFKQIKSCALVDIEEVVQA